jgi:glycosyltransferase involved in cell wall biosynthesis
MKLIEKSFFIVTHVYATGPAFKLEEYLVERNIPLLIFIGHPFSYAEDTRSFLRIYKEGRLILEKKFIYWGGPDFGFYVKDLLLTVLWGVFYVRYTRKIDYFVGVDNLNAFAGYVLQKLGIVKSIIFYTIDYIPIRFENKILNSIYHFLDSFAVKKSDKVWNLSSIMTDQREKRGMERKYKFKQIQVPIGTDLSSNPLPFSKIDKYKIVFMGHLRKGQGVDLLINAMEEVIREIPKAHLMIIGGGPLESKYRRMVKQKKLEKHIIFSGFIKDFLDVKKLLSDAAVAVAPYVDDSTTYTRYTDPGKPKDYIANGIPVIITKVPQVAFEIEKNKCGFAIDYDKKQLVDTLIKVLSNSKLQSDMRFNAVKMAKRYTWEKIFSKALGETIENN